MDGFAKTGLVAGHERESDEVALPQPVNTAFIGHFYTMNDQQGHRRYQVEALLLEYVGKAVPAFEKLAATQTD